MAAFPRFPLLALLGLLPVFPSTARSAAACGDAFTLDALDPAWTFFDADGAAGGSARVSAGKLELAGKGSDVYGNVNEYVGVKRAAAGDFDVSVKIESQTHTHGWAQAGILAANDAANPAKGGYVVVDVTPSNGYHAFYDAAGTVGTLDKHADAGKSAYPVWVRLARAGVKFSAWYKNQEQGAWLPIAEKFETQGTGGFSQLALVSLSHNDSAEAKTVFDDFACQGAAARLSPPGPWTGADRLRRSGSVSLPGFDASGRFRMAVPGAAGSSAGSPHSAPFRAFLYAPGEKE
ncbi:MAG TPA: hypothetical protein VJ385_05470 [Fibrobacteria bacterium]|nr:hypothetical protein [Fibrobacteria bacterium]